VAISRKPKSPSDDSNGVVDVEALINKGGSIASSPPAAPAKTAETVTINLRMPIPLVERIDVVLKSYPIKKPRHTWLLEAVIEKLEKEAD
jgi:hypothetical protein